MKRRAICIFHPDFEADTKEAVEAARAVCAGMKGAGQAMIDEMIREMKLQNPDFDDVGATLAGLAFTYKIMKVEVDE